MRAMMSAQRRRHVPATRVKLRGCVAGGVLMLPSKHCVAFLTIPPDVFCYAASLCPLLQASLIIVSELIALCCRPCDVE